MTAKHISQVTTVHPGKFGRIRTVGFFRTGRAPEPIDVLVLMENLPSSNRKRARLPGLRMEMRGLAQNDAIESLPSVYVADTSSRRILISLAGQVRPVQTNFIEPANVNIAY